MFLWLRSCLSHWALVPGRFRNPGEDASASGFLVFVFVGSSSGDATIPDAVAAVDEADSTMGSWVLNLEESDDPREAMQR